MKRWLYMISLLCLFASCERELPLPAPTESAKLTLVGELVANDSVQIRAGQSMFLGAKPDLPGGLQITLKDASGLEIPLQERADLKMYSLHTVPFSSSIQIEAGKKYSIRAKHPSLGEVTAGVSIPGPFNATLVERRFKEYSGDSVLLLDIDMNDAQFSDARYVVEMLAREISITGYFYFQSIRYAIQENKSLFDSLRNAGVSLSGEMDTSYYSDYSRQMFYTGDEDSENGSSNGRLFRRIFLSGKRFNGPSHRTQVLIPKSNLAGQSGLYVQLLIHIKSVSADYYDYLKAYEAYGTGPEPGSNNIPKQLPGNVTGGFGMIGGVWRWSLEMVF